MVGKNIIKLREHFGLTKMEFCDIIGVNRRTLERWESGERVPDLRRARVIIDKFYIQDVYTFMFGRRYEYKRSLTKIKKYEQRINPSEVSRTHR